MASSKLKNKDCECCADNTSRIISCPYCGYEACMRCLTHVITSKIEEPSCMHPECKKGFTFDFIVEKFSATFVDKIYPDWRKKILFEQEKALLPQTMIYVEQVKKLPEDMKEIEELRSVIKDLEQRKRQIELRAYYARQLRDGFIPEVSENQTEEEEVLKRVPIACPKNDCRGFLNHFYKCGLCEIQCCKDCREIKTEDDHKCDPNMLETIKMLQKECQNCPKCAIPIFKIDGCNQIWCVKCHTAFNWKTGKVETGAIHNPHYYQYMRENGKEILRAGGNYCGDPHQMVNMITRSIQRIEKPIERPLDDLFAEGLDKLEDFLKGIRNYNFLVKNSTKNYQQKLQNFVDMLLYIADIPNHIRYSYLNNVNIPTQHDNRSNLDLRIKFLMGEIDKDSFRNSLYRRKVANQKQLEYRQVIETYIQLCNEYTIQFFGTILQMIQRSTFEKLPETILTFVGEMNRILSFTQDAIDRINKLHKGRKVQKIGPFVM